MYTNLTKHELGQIDDRKLLDLHYEHSFKRELKNEHGVPYRSEDYFVLIEKEILYRMELGARYKATRF